MPSGWSFEVKAVNSGESYKLQSVMGSMTRSGTNTESYAVGNFVDLPVGEYRLTVKGQGDSRIFTLQKAWFTGDFSQSFLYLGIIGIFALLGALLFVVGLIQAVRKTAPQETG